MCDEKADGTVVSHGYGALISLHRHSSRANTVRCIINAASRAADGPTERFRVGTNLLSKGCRNENGIHYLTHVAYLSSASRRASVAAIKFTFFVATNPWIATARGESDLCTRSTANAYATITLSARLSSASR